ncbi:MAG TPA: hypothetical protein VHB79_38780 [Polyangiaceae bacterium]|nr:hypothetical protein [Polyangiaceae bacterium]
MAKIERSQRLDDASAARAANRAPGKDRANRSGVDTGRDSDSAFGVGIKFGGAHAALV